MFNNADGFFDDLPDLCKAKDLKARTATNMNAVERMQQKMLRQQTKLDNQARRV